MLEKCKRNNPEAEEPYHLTVQALNELYQKNDEERRVNNETEALINERSFTANFYKPRKGQPNDTLESLIIEGKNTINKDIIKEAVQKFYQELYERQEGLRKPSDDFTKYMNKISESNRRNLEKEITLDEIRNAIKRSKKRGCPGRDGFPFTFYEAMWDEIGEPLRDMYNNIRKNGQLCDSQKKA